MAAVTSQAGLAAHRDRAHSRLAGGDFSGRFVIEQPARADNGPRERRSARKVQVGGKLGARGRNLRIMSTLGSERKQGGSETDS